MQSRWTAVRQLLSDPISSMDGDVQLLIVMAKTRPTAVNLELLGDVLTSQSLGFDLGDTLVAWQRTMTWLGDKAKYVRTMLGPINEHAFLFDDPAVWGEVASVLRP